MIKVAVSSRSFSQHPTLRHQLQQAFAAVKFNEEGKQLTGDELVQFLKGAEQAIIGLDVVDEALLSALPDLKVICKMGTGIDKVDLDALKQRKIVFTHTPGVNKRSVSELVLGLIFTLLRHLSTVHANLKQGQWQQIRGANLTGKTVGIIGFGAIGRDLTVLLKAFDCQCIVYDVNPCEALPSYVSQADLNTLLSASDIISLHIPFTQDHYHFLGANELQRMKKNAILINTARGGLVDEKALYDVLKNKKIGGAAFDVFENEPHIFPGLLNLDNFFATSHIAGSTEEAILAMGLQAIENLKNAVIPLAEV